MKSFLVANFCVPVCLSFSCIALGVEQDVDFGVHLRAAHVDMGSNNSRAISAKLRATWQASWSDMLSTTLEVDHVSTGFNDEYDNGLRGNGEAHIPDVAGTEINQGFVQLDLSQWKVKAGRQLIEYDNQRFIGSNGFWQNEQTFDAVRVDYEFYNASRLSYAYIANANRIFGDGAKRELSITDINYDPINLERTQFLLGDHKHNTHLFNLRLKEWDHSELGFYYYRIDNRDVISESNNTFGSRFNYQHVVGSFRVKSHIEIATQTHPEQLNDERVNYHLIELAASLRSTELELRHETLGAKNGVRFITPLASLHDFQGWADKFGSQPTNGIVDNSLAVSWRRAPFKIDMRFHTFHSEEGNVDWGQELDIDFIMKIKRKHKFLLRYAQFEESEQSKAILPSETRLLFSYRYNI